MQENEKSFAPGKDAEHPAVVRTDMTITYYLFRRKHFVPEIGTYYSFDIVAYRLLYCPPVVVLRDVAVDGNLVLRMIQVFNKLQLSPIHLKDAVLDMLE